MKLLRKINTSSWREKEGGMEREIDEFERKQAVKEGENGVNWIKICSK